MIGRTLNGYIAMQFTRTMLAMLASFLLLIVLVDFIEQLRKASEFEGIEVLGLLQVSLFKAPIFIDKTFPFACLFAAMVTLTQLNQKMELVVARAAGVSAWQFLAPIAVAAMLIGFAAAFAYNPIAILAFERSKDIEIEVFDQRVRSRSNIAGYWIRQDEEVGSSVINARVARNFGTRLHDVKFIRFDDNEKIVERIDAETALYRGDYWLLDKATTIGDDGRAVVTTGMKIPTRLTADVLAGMTSDAESVPFWQLREMAAKALLSGGNPNPYLVQFYSLLALPLFLVAMVLIAASVTLRFARFGQVGRLILGGIVSGFLLYTITQVVTSLGSNGIVPPAAAAWSPSIVAILFGITILLYQEDG